jgi:hypothetical protein
MITIECIIFLYSRHHDVNARTTSLFNFAVSHEKAQRYQGEVVSTQTIHKYVYQTNIDDVPTPVLSFDFLRPVYGLCCG